MGRNGITNSEVFAIADALVAENIVPRVSNVRGRLGTGSDGTVQKHLSEWRKAQQQVVAAPFGLPKSVVDAICNEILRQTAEARAEVGSLLIIAQEEASDLAGSCIALEQELDLIREEIIAVSKSKDALLLNESKLTAEISRLADESNRDRGIIEQQRTEVAQLRNKVDLLETSLSEKINTINTLIVENGSESKAKTAAEKKAAVLETKFEYEQEKAKVLLSEKTTLTTQVTTERQATEAARLETALVTSELALKTKKLGELNTQFNSLSVALESEKLARCEAEKNIQQLAGQLEEAKQSAETAREAAIQLNADLEEKTCQNDELRKNYDADKLALNNAKQELTALRKKLKKQNEPDENGELNNSE